MEQEQLENKMDDKATENKIVHTHKTTEFGGRKFIIDERVVNKCINLVHKINTMQGTSDTVLLQDDAIELLKALQENEHHETKEI